MKKWETPEMVTLEVDKTADGGWYSDYEDFHVWSNADMRTEIGYLPSGVVGEPVEHKTTDLTISDWCEQNGFRRR